MDRSSVITKHAACGRWTLSYFLTAVLLILPSRGVFAQSCQVLFSDQKQSAERTTQFAHMRTWHNHGLVAKRLETAIAYVSNFLSLVPPNFQECVPLNFHESVPRDFHHVVPVLRWILRWILRVPEHSATLFRGHGATPNRSIPPPSFRVGNSSPFSRSKFTVVVRFPENSTSGDQWQQRDWKCVAFGMFCVFILFQHCRRRRLRRLKGAAARLCASTWGGL